MAHITVQPGSYREATVILMRDGVAVGEIVALAVYERHSGAGAAGGELCVTLGLGLPDGLQAVRLDTAPLPEEWDGWVGEREAEYAAQYLPFTLTAQRGGNPSSASSGRWPKPPRNGNGGHPAKSSGRWPKPDRAGGRPKHNGRRW